MTLGSVDNFRFLLNVHPATLQLEASLGNFRAIYGSLPESSPSRTICSLRPGTEGSLIDVTFRRYVYRCEQSALPTIITTHNNFGSVAFMQLPDCRHDGICRFNWWQKRPGFTFAALLTTRFSIASSLRINVVHQSLRSFAAFSGALTLRANAEMLRSHAVEESYGRPDVPDGLAFYSLVARLSAVQLVYMQVGWKHGRFVYLVSQTQAIHMGISR